LGTPNIVEGISDWTNADLVAKARDGDGEAFADLVEPHLARALTGARLIVGDTCDPADVVQEALLSAWRGLGGLRDAAALGSWFRQHVVRTAWRVAKRSRHTVALDDTWVDPVDQVERGIAQRDMRRALSRLDPDDRVLLTLRFHLDLPHEETARLLHVPVGTVKSRVHYALERLRAAYDAEERK
jgi:RNA polymerase sigma-70 factor (ECF subfamily)